MKRIVLAYSGSLATSAAIPWLRERHGAEVVTVTLDLGQERDLAAVRERALALGAARAHVVDARDEFVRDYLLPALAAGAIEAGAPLSRPLVAKRLVDLARMESATAVAHGARPGREAATAIGRSVGALDPALAVLTAADDADTFGSGLLGLARAHGLPVPAPAGYHVDASIWGRALKPGHGGHVPEDAFTLTRTVDECPDHAAVLDLEFADGVAVRANGVEMSMLELIESLETIAGAHGVGRWQVDGLHFEAPAIAVLGAAHRALETFVVGDDLARLKAQLAGVFAQALARGDWFTPAREAVQGFAAVVQRRVTGSVRLELLKGSCLVVSRASRYAAAPDAAARPGVEV